MIMPIVGMILGPAIFPMLPAILEEAEVDHPVWRVINLAVFLAVMIYLFRNRLHIGKLFEDRSTSIRRELEEARKEKEEAESRLIEIESRLKHLDEEAAEIKAKAEIEAQQEAERIRQTAEADSEKIKELARREIEGGMRAARAELRSFVAELSVGRAEENIRRNIKAEDESKILTGYVRELGEVNK